MNIDFKLSIYRMIRNYVCLRLFRTFIKHYNKWELSQENAIEHNNELPLPGNIIPYNNAVNSLTALKLRGGNSDLPLIIALFKIIHIIKKYMKRLLPKAIVDYFRAYAIMKDNNPKLILIEDLVILLISVATASITSRNRSQQYILSYDVIKDKSDIDFAAVAEKLGVNLDICEFNKSFMFEALMSRDLNDREKLEAFRFWLKEFNLSNNSGAKQGLLLCLIAMLVFFFLNNYALFLEILMILKQAVINGEISKSMYRLIIKKLKKKGFNVPSSYN